MYSSMSPSFAGNPLGGACLVLFYPVNYAISLMFLLLLLLFLEKTHK